MSTTSFIACGYGFPVNTLNTTAFINFINNHKATIQTILTREYNKISEPCRQDIKRLITFCETALQTTNTIDVNINNMTENFNKIEDIHGNEHMLGILSLIMQEETGISFEYQKGREYCDSKPSILFARKLPWNFTLAEQKLESEDDLKAVIVPYVTELQLSISDIDHLEIEYYN